MNKLTTVKVSTFTRDVLNELKKKNSHKSVDEMLKLWIKEKNK